VETKITKNLPANFPEGLQIDPTNAYEFALANGESNQELIVITQNEIGSYHVVFELWQQGLSGYKFTGNYCQLNINVIS
jgi:hypothetical protein